MLKLHLMNSNYRAVHVMCSAMQGDVLRQQREREREGKLLDELIIFNLGIVRGTVMEVAGEIMKVKFSQFLLAFDFQ